MLEVVGTSGVLELVEDAAQLRFEAALLCGSELRCNGEIGQVGECLADALETLLELGGDR